MPRAGCTKKQHKESAHGLPLTRQQTPRTRMVNALVGFCRVVHVTPLSNVPNIPDTQRRQFLKTATIVGGAVVSAAPMAAVTPTPISFRWQSTWPVKDIFHEYALDFARKVNDMSGKRLRIDVLPAGAVVKPFDLIDAVSRGALDGGHGVTAYWYGKNSAIALWGSGPAFGMDANTVLAWHEFGGGKALLADIYKSLKLDVMSFLYGPMPTQPLGWFKKPITKVEDFKGLKYRTAGLSIELFSALGAAVNALPSGEIVAAMDRGQLDAAEFNNTTSDKTLGFPDVSKVCMLQSFHQCSEQFEILFNRTKFNTLSRDLQAIIQNAVQAASAEMSWKAIDRYSQDYINLQKSGIKFYKTPDAILQAQLDAWDEIARKKSAENPAFKKVLQSMQTFAERACRWQNETNVDYKMAFNKFSAGK
jgi:TRAP-type mannitol/chloroaromatic compound transport system substrate-binding protein